MNLTRSEIEGKEQEDSKTQQFSIGIFLSSESFSRSLTSMRLLRNLCTPQRRRRCLVTVRWILVQEVLIWIQTSTKTWFLECMLLLRWKYFSMVQIQNRRQLSGPSKSEHSERYLLLVWAFKRNRMDQSHIQAELVSSTPNSRKNMKELGDGSKWLGFMFTTCRMELLSTSLAWALVVWRLRAWETIFCQCHWRRVRHWFRCPENGEICKTRFNSSN